VFDKQQLLLLPSSCALEFEALIYFTTLPHTYTHTHQEVEYEPDGGHTRSFNESTALQRLIG
jgi:hypothetical protein